MGDQTNPHREFSLQRGHAYNPHGHILMLKLKTGHQDLYALTIEHILVYLPFYSYSLYSSVLVKFIVVVFS